MGKSKKQIDREYRRQLKGLSKRERLKKQLRLLEHCLREEGVLGYIHIMPERTAKFRFLVTLVTVHDNGKELWSTATDAENALMALQQVYCLNPNLEGLFLEDNVISADMKMVTHNLDPSD